MFTLHPQLFKDTVLVGYLPLSVVLLTKDANYPWCILVPRRDDVREVHQLNVDDRTQLLKESCELSEVMEQLFSPIKMNVAALGNVVPQLHLHHVARFEDDPAWPKPIWGVVDAVDYQEDILQQRIESLQRCLSSAGLSKVEVER